MKPIFLFGFITVLAAITGFHNPGIDNADHIVANGRMPKIITDLKGNIHLTYGTGDSIMYMVSSDQGSSFSTPQLVAVLPKLFASAMRGPQIAAASNGIIITANTMGGNIYSYQKEVSGKWSNGIKVNDVDSVSKEALTSLGAEGSSAFAVWIDGRSNGGKGQQLYGALSHDAGRTWSKNILVYASPDKTICECCKPSVQVKGNVVVAMFRNWLKGNRDLYLVKSSDYGKSFGKAQKLGAGSWKLDGCPMDGGGFELDSYGKIETVWRREGNIFASAEGKPETLLGEGRSCSMTTVDGENVYTWTKDGEVVIMKPGKEIRKLGRGSVPVINAVGNGKVICVWENEKQVHASVVNM